MWTKDGTYNQNKGNVCLKPFLVPKIVADIKELPAVEPEERATNSKVVCGRIVKVVQPDVDLGRYGVLAHSAPVHHGRAFAGVRHGLRGMLAASALLTLSQFTFANDSFSSPARPRNW